MKVKLLKDNYYVSETDGNKFGKKDEVINIDSLFYKLISDICKPVKMDEAEEKEEKKNNKKPLDKMNKAELIAKAEELELGLTEEQTDAMSKADIIKLIVAKKN